MNIAEKFKKDALWMLSELKQEEMANAYSEFQIKFLLEQESKDVPDLRSQRRILKMLYDRKAISTSPFYQGSSLFTSIFEMQGARPIGYHIQVLQPKFDEVMAEITEDKVPQVQPKPAVPKLPESKPTTTQTYFITYVNRKVLLNNTFVLANTDFNSENDQFMDYMYARPNVTLKREDIVKTTGKLKKSFHAIVNGLGFKGEVRKIFLEVSKTALLFRNNVPFSN